MATSTCTKCGKTQFEFKLVEPIGADYKVNFIQCNSCGGVIGVLDFYAIGELILRLAEGLKVPLDQ